VVAATAVAARCSRWRHRHRRRRTIPSSLAAAAVSPLTDASASADASTTSVTPSTRPPSAPWTPMRKSVSPPAVWSPAARKRRRCIITLNTNRSRIKGDFFARPVGLKSSVVTARCGGLRGNLGAGRDSPGQVCGCVQGAPVHKVGIYRRLKNSIPFTDRYTDLPISLPMSVKLKYCYLISYFLPKTVHHIQIFDCTCFSVRPLRVRPGRQVS